MSVSDKLFVSRLSFIVLATVILLIGYAIYDTYANEIQDEVARILHTSFGHLKGQLANL